MIAQLEAHKLIQIHFHSNPQLLIYIELHLLLPYFIGHGIMHRPSGDGQSILDQPYTMFREYHKLRSQGLLVVDPRIDIFMELMSKERISLRNAIKGRWRYSVH